MEQVLAGPGTVLAGRYTLERELGRGGMATVFLARDQKHQRRVAIKILRPEVAASLGSERFLREIQIAACLTHPHILPLHDSGESGDLLYYVMPFVEGESLRQRLDRQGTIPLAEALRITGEVADALAYAHQHGIIHRDIKPGNILLESGHAVVADFGIARAVSAAGGAVHTTSGVAVGTPMYMSPEQISGTRIDGRSDVYSLGCVLYEMLTGSPPFRGPNAEAVVAKQLYEQPPSLTSQGQIPPAVARAIQRALAKHPDARYPDADGFVEALHEAPSAATQPIPGRRRSRTRIGFLIASVASLLAAIPLVGRLLGTSGLESGAPAPWIMVADFEGPADDRTLPIAVRELVRAELDRSRIITPMPRQLVTSVMRDAGMPDTAALTSELARELALRSSVRTVLGGSVLPIAPGRYSIVLRVSDADSGRTLVTVTRSARDNDLVSAVQTAARQVRRELGERRDAIASNTPLVQVATPSLPAYRKYVEAVGLSERGHVDASNRLLQEALVLDTGFASAWGTMASNYLAMRNLDSARIALAEALQRRARLSDAQRYRLLADGDYMLRYDIPGAIRWYDLLLQIAPRSLAGHNNRAALLHSLGRYEEALDGFRRTEELEPFGTPQAQIEIFNQVVTLVAMGRDADAAVTARKLSGLYADYAAELLATYRGEWVRAESLATELTRNPATPAWLKTPATTVIAGARAARGAVAQADAQLRAAAASSQGAARVWFSNAVLLLAASSGRDPGPPPRWILADTSAGGLLASGLWAAVTGDVRLARSRYEALQREPAIDQKRLGLGPVLLRGYTMAAENRWSDVVAQIRGAALTGELDGGDLNQVSSMAVRLLMAQAYERTGSPDSATMMYELIVNPARTPFTHLALRGLAYPFASRRLAQLRQPGETAGS